MVHAFSCQHEPVEVPRRCKAKWCHQCFWYPLVNADQEPVPRLPESLTLRKRNMERQLSRSDRVDTCHGFMTGLVCLPCPSCIPFLRRRQLSSFTRSFFPVSPSCSCRACDAVRVKCASSVGVCVHVGSVSCCCSCAPLPRWCPFSPSSFFSLFFGMFTFFIIFHFTILLEGTTCNGSLTTMTKGWRCWCLPSSCPDGSVTLVGPGQLPTVYQRLTKPSSTTGARQEHDPQQNFLIMVAEERLT